MNLVNLNSDVDLTPLQDTDLEQRLEELRGEIVAGKIEAMISERNLPGVKKENLLTAGELFREQHREDQAVTSRYSRLRTLLVPDSLRDPIIAEIRKEFPDVGDKFSGFFEYPPGGFMTWHTNSNDPGHRMYASYVAEGGKSYFRYADPETGEIKDSVDASGWTLRVFKLTKETPLWHCVGADIQRLSFGFKLQAIQ